MNAQQLTTNANTKPLPGWKLSAKPRRCNLYPTVWAAMYGCKGEQTRAWRYGVYNLGVQHVQYACATCQAADALTAAMNHKERQAHLNAIQEANGVADYRYQKTTRINGVPTLVRK